ncbi:MAG: hypothetical protein ACK56I_32955, partial [bacterium]
MNRLLLPALQQVPLLHGPVFGDARERFQAAWHGDAATTAFAVAAPPIPLSRRWVLPHRKVQQFNRPQAQFRRQTNRVRPT